MSRPKYVAGYKAAHMLVESLLELIERRDVSRAELARLNEVDRSTVTKWLTPGRNLTVFTAAMIAESLGGELEIRIKDLQEAANADEYTINQGQLPNVRVILSNLDTEAADLAQYLAAENLRLRESLVDANTKALAYAQLLRRTLPHLPEEDRYVVEFHIKPRNGDGR